MGVKGCIYRIVNFRNGKSYIGQTVDVARRKTNHFNELKSGVHHNTALLAAYRKYGRSAFYFEVIETGVPSEIIDEREIHWINMFDAIKQGYNRASGGKAKGCCPVPRKCTWNGIEYNSIREAALSNNVSEPTMRRRIVTDGRENDTEVKTGPGKYKSCEWNGIQYESIHLAASAIGITHSTMWERVLKGYKSDNDLKKKPIPRKCIWNGVEYPTIKQAALANNVSDNAMIRRIDIGYKCDSDMRVTPKH